MKHGSNQLWSPSSFLIFEFQTSIFFVGGFDPGIFGNENKIAYFLANTFHIIKISSELHHLLDG